MNDYRKKNNKKLNQFVFYSPQGKQLLKFSHNLTSVRGHLLGFEKVVPY